MSKQTTSLYVDKWNEAREEWRKVAALERADARELKLEPAQNDKESGGEPEEQPWQWERPVCRLRAVLCPQRVTIRAAAYTVRRKQEQMPRVRSQHLIAHSARKPLGSAHPAASHVLLAPPFVLHSRPLVFRPHTLCTGTASHTARDWQLNSTHSQKLALRFLGDSPWKLLSFWDGRMYWLESGFALGKIYWNVSIP